jgi:glutamate synthase domain-containing protein 3
MATASPGDLHEYDLASGDVRTLNQRLHDLTEADCATPWRIVNPKGVHAIACGMRVPAKIEIDGHAGYYCAGMNQSAEITVRGNVGVGVAENMMSGMVRVAGQASQSAGATGRGGLLVIEGSAVSRCGISLKGLDIVVAGSVGPMSCFMAQLGTLVVCGDAGEALGDSLYEARIFVRGSVKNLGADCIEKPMRDEHHELLASLLERAGIDLAPTAFRRYGSARKLYNFHVDNASRY